MGEGAEVRKAFDQSGPELDHDEFIGHMEARIREERQRSSDASESAERSEEFNEKTGMNNQALGWCKSILKKLDKKDGEHKAMDIVRSLECALPLLKDHITGQQGEMPLDEPEEEIPAGFEENPDDDETEAFNADVDEAVDGIEPFDPSKVELPHEEDDAA